MLNFNVVSIRRENELQINWISLFTEVPAVPRSSVDTDPPYDTEMEDSQSDNVLLKIRGKLNIIFPKSILAGRLVICPTIEIKRFRSCKMSKCIRTTKNKIFSSPYCQRGTSIHRLATGRKPEASVLKPP